MQGQIVRLHSKRSRQIAHQLIESAPKGAVVQVREAKRTDDQNSKMWAMLSDISRQIEHNSHKYTPEVWKSLFMHACGQEIKFIMGLNGDPFPLGYRSSRMSKSQMADLITFIIQFGDENGVRWTDEAQQ